MIGDGKIRRGITGGDERRRPPVFVLVRIKGLARGGEENKADKAEARREKHENGVVGDAH